MQTWPALRYLNAAMVSAAFSGSASANTTTGEWPPSSMVVRFMPLAASPARCLPTGIEPVKEILRTASLARRYSETSAGTPNTRLSTPAGRPASAKQRTISTQAPGVSSEALRMSERPAASAPPFFRAVYGIGLALLQHHDFRARDETLAHQIRSIVQDLAAVVGRGGAPHRKAL